MSGKFSNWLEERTGFRTWSRRKGAQAVPSHVGWFHYCFGGLSLFIIVLQVLSGIFMVFFYKPEPLEALKSIEYLSNEVTLGWFFRNLHRWGSTLLIATIFTHMIAVIHQRAYRNPRELNWVSGLLQFMVVFLLLATGLILPWDWRAYWSFSIWVDYFATWPLVGDFLKNFLLDTFSINRSFVLHILVLPLTLFILLFFHFRMVKKHGISEPL
ncbi:MAG: cytochrome b N-terminal domain-containing protein [Magnetococcales bacterium]|nr:cytochrome b N-terminal domain-containing protein [Magnetococcales bacterium]